MRIGLDSAVVSIIIPCLNEEQAIGPLVASLWAAGLDEVIVVDGGSTDRTAEIARTKGATVVLEPRRGYGRACAAGAQAARVDATILAFIDGDGSDDPGFAKVIIGPVMRREADFCIASRLRGARENGSMTASQIVAGRLAGMLVWVLYGARYTDMAPFRALRRDTLMTLGMRETTFGWNLEMQMRIAARRLVIREVPTGCRQRNGGVSKVSGDLRAVLPAAATLVRTFLRLALVLRRSPVR
ncbi:glycosyltransferase family 2 protein [Lichenihabitans sp. PAMC28606]|uniref:glycosyltransferase family 2 protein n=1 Tax=Lichenihabitans sp. PAMC28606 TaxID=2880932 RepID=UPI001D0B83CB|nr:glycosyltransferase family 2 protein [Lichenihabitans sp. PAMC28606]UDL93104.1 glycosyltransferase family 2 protein [Lichenihabitans sp. PAMC28606]